MLWRSRNLLPEFQKHTEVKKHKAVMKGDSGRSLHESVKENIAGV